MVNSVFYSQLADVGVDNLVPLFDMILLGMPNRQMILLQMKLASVALVSRRRVTIQSIWYSIWLRLGSICGP